MPSLLQRAPCLSKGLLGYLVHLFSAQGEIVALIGSQDQLQYVLVIWRVPLGLRTVDEALNLIGEGGRGFRLRVNLL